ncbi:MULTISPECIES: hypothetical protein, partial [unclassified Endozoicomonas]
TTEDYLHAIIYHSDGQLSVFSYQDQVNVHRFDTTIKPATAESMRPVFVGDNVYLAVENADIEGGSRQVQMQAISLGIENYNYQKPAAASSSAGSSSVLPDWGIGLIAAGTVLAVSVAVIVVVKRFKKQPLGTEAETHELLSF